MDICPKGRESFRHASSLITGPIPKAGRQAGRQAGRLAIQETQLFTNCRVVSQHPATLGEKVREQSSLYGGGGGGGGGIFGL
jgi:hypothetical protein